MNPSAPRRRACARAAAVVALGFLHLGCAGADRELIRDPNFQNGFWLLAPEPGKRVVCGRANGFTPDLPVWDLAQWSSRFPLGTNELVVSDKARVWSNAAKQVVIARTGSKAAGLSLGVRAGAEYKTPRKSSQEPWVHLLVQQSLENPPSLAQLDSCQFRLEARLRRAHLADTNGYSPALHAAQFLVYLTVGNRNPASPGYLDCFWFGIPVYDNRERIVPAYEARDFGDTRRFIFTPASDNFTRASTHDKDWVVFEKDILPLLRRGLERSAAKGFLKSSPDPGDFRLLGIFLGWEVPGSFDVELEIRGLSLRAQERPLPANAGGA